MKNHDHIDKLKEVTDPQRVAIALGLQRRGRRFFCPICQPQGGKTPDLVVGDKGFICHKCGEKGDTIKLIEIVLNVTFPEAIKWLENETGLPSDGSHNGRYIRASADKGRGKIVEPGPTSQAVLSHPVKKIGYETESAIYEAFLTACRPVEGSALTWLTKVRLISEDVIQSLKIRLCGKEYSVVIDILTKQFGEESLYDAGLLKKSASNHDRLVPSFWYYFANKIDFLVIPYIQDGRPVYLKARPPMGKEEAEKKNLVRFINTAAAVPCLYNFDALKDKQKKILICEGESDTWTALSCGSAAVGSPGAYNFKPSWIENFRGFQNADGRSTVYLVMDADKAGKKAELIIADMFLKAGLPVPLKIVLPPGMDLTEYTKGGLTE